MCAKDPPEKLIPWDKICVAWALGHRAPCDPLLIISRGSLAITSIAVHPKRPNIFCTTSRDTTTRIYDLTLSPIEFPNNPRWPPSKEPSLAGAAHGLHMNEPEGGGLGRCIMVLMGSRSGGHSAAVLGAAFSEHQPLIATCGMDRCVKIWAVRSDDPESITREDKPLFSSSRIHKAMVLSVSWLHPDFLITHSAPAEMRVDPVGTKNKETYLDPGEVVVWQWLGLNRFYPPDLENALEGPQNKQRYRRGCASDYQESSSFKFITVYSLDGAQSRDAIHHLHAFHSPFHDPLILTALTGSDRFQLTNVATLEPRKMPTFSEFLPELIRKDLQMNWDPAEVSAATQAVEKDEPPPGEAGPSSVGSTSINEPTTRPRGGEPPRLPISRQHRLMAAQRPVYQPETLPGREIQLPGDAAAQFIVGVGTHSTIWIWKLVEGRASSAAPSPPV
ncbi:hypothetical protein DFP72DRAFT_838730 [Ephemerocybe angulata]|uniref:Uncharacterized protein n=1 Tax=Ephemerocybe angulata TaxID=980116 RepID=A0A8H6IIP5_9AGAR|nr:hypothetical protein DFP72DRAFT_838730 [Tulosesus angulatus]